MSSLPTHLLYGAITPISISLPERPSVGVTVSCYTDAAAALFEGQTATVDSASTTTSGTVASGDTSFSVASATGISAGDYLYVGSHPREIVRVQSISGTNVTTWAPMLYDHATGVVVESTKVTYSVTAAQADTKFWDGYLLWTVDSGQSTEKAYTQAAICTDYPFYRVASEADWRLREPLLDKLIEGDVPADAILDEALADVVKRIAAKTRGRAWAYRGPHQFSTATVLAAQRIVYQSRSGDESERMYLRYTDELSRELDMITAGVATRDTDGDQVASPTEQISMRSIRIGRA